MASPVNHWKLGLFVVVGFVVAMGTVALLGAHAMRREIGQYVTFFDESVQGVDVGSPIKFRGVTIGNVGRIDVAKDHRLVQVTLELGVEELRRLGLDVGSGPAARGAEGRLYQDVDLRVQLASAGVTGVKFLQLDFFVVADTPAPTLPFAPPDNYIPSAPSTLKNLEDALVRTMARLPELADQAGAILASIRAVVGSVEERRVAERLAATLEAASLALGQTTGAVAKLERVSSKAEGLLDGLRVTVQRTNEVLADVGSEKGLLASVGRASDAVGDTVRNADRLGGELEEALGAMREAARSVHKLADALEKDPDMLLKGRAKRGAR